MITATPGRSAIATPTGGTSTGASAWSRWSTARRTESQTVSSQETKAPTARAVTAPTAATLTTSPSWRSCPASPTSPARTWAMASSAAPTRLTPRCRARAATRTPTRPRPPPGSPREWWRTDQEPPCSRPRWPWASSWWWQCLWGNKWRIFSDRAAGECSWWSHLLIDSKNQTGRELGKYSRDNLAVKSVIELRRLWLQD